MDRRTFIMATAALAAGCGRTVEMTTPLPLGIQLYTLRDMMAENVAATLELVSSVGYREVEFAGYFDHTPEQVHGLLDALGLAAPSTHAKYDAFVAEPNKVIDHAAAMGHKYVLVAYLEEEQRTMDGYREHCDNFNRWGEACAAAGLQFAYHNHDFEFDDIDGVIPYDFLLAETDPDLVAMQLDLGWAGKANADVIAYFKAWPGRFPSLHIKDMSANGDAGDIGTGDVDFETIFKYAEDAGVRHGFVEQDNAADVKSSIQHDFNAILPLWNAYMQSA